MSHSPLFHSDAIPAIEAATLLLLQGQSNFLTAVTQDSPRAVGDAVQSLLAEQFRTVIQPYSKDYSAAFARRSMADIAFTGLDELYYVVDVKTHRLDTEFNMPNLTSVERLTRLYEDDSNIFCVLLVDYQIQANQAHFSRVRFFPIEFIAWQSLTIGALGWGQLQMSNISQLILQPQSRKAWMLSLCEHVLAFYPREIAKITERIGYFEAVYAAWRAKPDER